LRISTERSPSGVKSVFFTSNWVSFGMQKGSRLDAD
jgi:hypothetical protein